MGPSFSNVCPKRGEVVLNIVYLINLLPSRVLDGLSLIESMSSFFFICSFSLAFAVGFLDVLCLFIFIVSFVGS